MNVMGNLTARMMMKIADSNTMQLTEQQGNSDTGGYVIDNVLGVIQTVMTTLLALLGMAAIVFAIYVGFRLASAEDEGKRKEAKKQLLWTILAVIAVVVLIVVFSILVAALGPSTPGGDDGWINQPPVGLD